MKKAGLVIFLLLFAARFSTLLADEGMWLPMLLGDYPESEMQRLGMKITAEDIYNINKPSLKDAVVMFGGVCTAEIISEEGLLLTNHHCGFSSIQALSSIKSDYITNGFWAMNRAEELPNPGLKIVMLVRMDDVTQQVLAGVKDGMDDISRKNLVQSNIAKIESDAMKGNHYVAKVKAFFYGNQYFLVLSEEFIDVRLVGAPPNRIGDFGGETDNWMWPRHTGDFSLFRIYAGKDNQPAPYSPENIPYKPKKSLAISIKGVKENDFTLLMGFPGTTQEYLPSYALEVLYMIEDPAAIKIREHRIEIMEKYMAISKLTKIQYSNKLVIIANGWKKMFGEVTGIRRLGAIQKKKETEILFQQWANENAERKKVYGNVLSNFQTLYEKYKPLRLAYIFYKEAGLGIEIIQYANTFSKLIELSKSDTTSASVLNTNIDFFKQGAKGFFKNYNMQLDKETFITLMGLYYKDLDHAYIPDTLVKQGDRFGGDFAKNADYIFTNSELVSEKKVTKLLSEYSAASVSRIEQDPIYMLARNIYSFYADKIAPQLSSTEAEVLVQQRLYMKGIMEMQSNKNFYPDANGTLRLSYGTVKGYELHDGVINNYFTTLDGVIAKEDTLSPDYMVDAKLKDLWKTKDYGRYADKDGRMHVCFLATNHTTGGNSGSPVLNADGQLIGLHFDRVWEGTMSDIYYDPDKCRNIAIDIRYVLFLIDKYAGASNLIKEMTIVE
jgi:hypothetical protein